MLYYGVFHKDHIPEAMLAKWKSPAFYIAGMLALFCEDYETITGQEFADNIDLGANGWNPSGDPEQEGTTPEQLQAMVTDMLTWTPTGRQILLPKVMGKWLYKNDERFKPEVVEE